MEKFLEVVLKRRSSQQQFVTDVVIGQHPVRNTSSPSVCRQSSSIKSPNVNSRDNRSHKEMYPSQGA